MSQYSSFRVSSFIIRNYSCPRGQKILKQHRSNATATYLHIQLLLLTNQNFNRFLLKPESKTNTYHSLLIFQFGTFYRNTNPSSRICTLIYNEHMPTYPYRHFLISTYFNMYTFFSIDVSPNPCEFVPCPQMADRMRVFQTISLSI